MFPGTREKERRDRDRETERQREKREDTCYFLLSLSSFLLFLYSPLRLIVVCSQAPGDARRTLIKKGLPGGIPLPSFTRAADFFVRHPTERERERGGGKVCVGRDVGETGRYGVGTRKECKQCR